MKRCAYFGLFPVRRSKRIELVKITGIFYEGILFVIRLKKIGRQNNHWIFGFFILIFYKKNVSIHKKWNGACNASLQASRELT